MKQDILTVIVCCNDLLIKLLLIKPDSWDSDLFKILSYLFKIKMKKVSGLKRSFKQRIE